MPVTSEHGSAPRVSILIPTYNYGRYLRQAIESVLAQDFIDFELIISDDASTDDTVDVLREFAARDGRIRVHLHPQNTGMVQNWNWCLQQARGEYIKFMFGDDGFAQPNALSEMVAALDNAPEAVLVSSARLIVDECSRPRTIWNDFRNSGLHFGLKVISRCMQQDMNLVGEPSAVMFRRSASQRGFDPALRQLVDLEFWFHLLLRGDFVYLPQPYCIFRQHETQQTLANRSLNIGPMESLLILARYLDCVSDPEHGGFTRFQRRRMLFRRLYYSRKNVPRSAAILVAEAMIGAHLSLPEYTLMWSLHRMTKPFTNLDRYLRTLLGGRMAPPLRSASTGLPINTLILLSEKIATRYQPDVVRHRTSGPANAPQPSVAA